MCRGSGEERIARLVRCRLRNTSTYHVTMWNRREDEVWSSVVLANAKKGYNSKKRVHDIKGYNTKKMVNHKKKRRYAAKVSVCFR